MTFQRNRYGSDLDILEISEKDLADKVGLQGWAMVVINVTVITVEPHCSVVECVDKVRPLRFRTME